MAREKKKLDTVVKMGLGVFIGAFALIWGGMFLTRPDRSIPPYSIGSQEGAAVAVHVPVYTSDTELETLIYRFQKVARDKGFGRMKIRPTTPDDPAGPYQRITIYVFTHEAWAEPDMLRRYVAASRSALPKDKSLREAFEKAVRGFYRLDESGEEGRIGPIDGILGVKETPATAAFSRVLFSGPISATSLDQTGLPEREP
ncbi:MAG: hypothetical protein M3Z35_08415 [Nitrospirota bacterium]|nr:hypothetical protein [Nitrospirota bacterium]